MNAPHSGPSEAALAAWSISFLAGQDAETRDVILRDSRTVKYHAGAIISTGGLDYKVLLIHSGTVHARR